MRKLLVIVGLAAIALFLLPAHSAHSQAPADNLISIKLDDVDLTDVVRMFSRIADVHIQYDPAVLSHVRPVSVDLTDEPWRPAFQALLATRGLVLLAEPGAHNNFTIVKADSLSSAVRIQYASAAVALAEAALADIKANNVASATARLEDFADSNRQTVKAFEESQKKPQNTSTNDAPRGIVTPAPRPEH